jgi:hypothetical protein
MTLVMPRDMNSSDNGDGYDSGGGGGGGPAQNSRKYECDNCRAEFPNKTTADRHMLFCRTLAEIRRGGGGSAAGAGIAANDALMPTQREMFILIQELAAKYNKVKDELDVMKQWAKMVGRRIGGAGAGAGLDFTSVTRQKRQNMEVILNEEDAAHPDLAGLRLGFTEWLSLSPTLYSLTESDLNVVFNEDLVAGITAAILRILAGYTAESGRSHLVPFKLADIKQGAFYIYETAFGVVAAPPSEIATDLPLPFDRKWRAMEACEFQLLVRTFHKLLFKEFKKWQDANWEAQKQMTQQRQKAASSYQQIMSAAHQPQYQCSPGMASCDGMYAMGGAVAAEAAEDATAEDDTPTTPLGEPVLSEDFATLYNKYADKMMGGALSDDTILARVRAKLWKDMKGWRL